MWWAPAFFYRARRHVQKNIDGDPRCHRAAFHLGVSPGFRVGVVQSNTTTYTGIVRVTVTAVVPLTLVPQRSLESRVLLDPFLLRSKLLPTKGFVPTLNSVSCETLKSDRGCWKGLGSERVGADGKC